MVTSFAHKIQSEYYGDNLFVSIEGIELEHSSSTTKSETASAPKLCTGDAEFQLFCLVTVNKTMPQQLHTENASSNC